MFKLFVLKRTTLFLSLNFLGIILISKNSFAVADFGTAGVLPVGRHQTTFRVGNVSGIQDKFDQSGVLRSPSRMNKRIDNAMLMKNPQFKEFAKILDSLTPGREISKEIDPGAVEFKGNAEVDYFAPQIARGITTNWTVGVAIPFVRYHSDIRAENAGINTAPKVLAVMSERLDETSGAAAKQVAILKEGPKALFKDQANIKGYKELSPRDEQFMGDVVLGSSLRLYNTRYVDFYMLNQLTLPTGPKDDPDDFVDLNIFGKTNFQTMLYTNYKFFRRLELGLGVSYTLGIEDDIVKRVPTYEGDDLPDVSTKERVDKDPGDSVGAQAAAIYKVSDYFQAGVGYEVSYKNSDKYSGTQGSRYDLLEKNTDTEVSLAKFKATYSTLDGFLQGNEKIPYSVTYAFADVVDGKNIEREMTHELLLKFYF